MALRRITPEVRPMSRIEARALGLKLYTAGKPCAHGHAPCVRRVIDGACLECRKLAANEYRSRAKGFSYKTSKVRSLIQRVLRHDPAAYQSVERVNGFAYDCYEAEILGFDSYFSCEPCENGHYDLRHTRNNLCHTCNREKTRSYVRRNREKVRAIALTSAARNSERLATYNAWYRSQPENRQKHRVSSSVRRGGKLAGRYTVEQIAALHVKQKGRCPNCYVNIKNLYHIDHIIPVVRGGTSAISNIQLLCPPCNQKKSSKDPVAWAQEQGRLL